MGVSSPFLFCNQRIEGETKTAKSWRHPLSKPPARSPMTLVKQQATSDEGRLVKLFSIFSVYIVQYSVFCQFAVTNFSKKLLGGEVI